MILSVWLASTKQEKLGRIAACPDGIAKLPPSRVPTRAWQQNYYATTNLPKVARLRNWFMAEKSPPRRELCPVAGEIVRFPLDIPDSTTELW